MSLTRTEVVNCVGALTMCSFVFFSCQWLNRTFIRQLMEQYRVERARPRSRDRRDDGGALEWMVVGREPCDEDSLAAKNRYVTGGDILVRQATDALKASILIFCA
ncbi:b38.1 [miniopterid betaherpesvirus 1]|uniref:B38.1 n=1 Tax=miniopterid betaherpesvirus 1 TaxID=3070189 RepID=I3VQ14_9BETA|nr:b38.1 [miniopterid betaherpesvirus 1]AFK83858.1 b38.1 [miniopterid betaherpesvirus 1]